MTQQNDASGEVERAANMLRAMLLDVPDYDGEDPRARFYRSQRENLQTAIQALAQPNHAGASREEIARAVHVALSDGEDGGGFHWGAATAADVDAFAAHVADTALSLSRPTGQMGEDEDRCSHCGDDLDTGMECANSACEACNPDTKAVYPPSALSNPPTPGQVGGDVETETIERCAKVAESHADDRPGRDRNFDWNDGYMDACRSVASAIRALPIESAKSAENAS